MDNIYDIYTEVVVQSKVFEPGVYRFTPDMRFGRFGAHTTLVQFSERTWAETDDGVFWMKNRMKPTPDKLTKDELKEFMWVKLKATTL